MRNGLPTGQHRASRALGHGVRATQRGWLSSACPSVRLRSASPVLPGSLRQPVDATSRHVESVWTETRELRSPEKAYTGSSRQCAAGRERARVLHPGVVIGGYAAQCDAWCAVKVLGGRRYGIPPRSGAGPPARAACSSARTAVPTCRTRSVRRARSCRAARCLPLRAVL